MANLIKFVSELCRKENRCSTKYAMKKQKAATSIFIDKYHPKLDGLCAISIRVTYERKKKYYPTIYSLTLEEFEKVQGIKPRNDYKEINQALNQLEQKATDVINSLHVFTWKSFEKYFLSNRGAKDVLSNAFADNASKFKESNRISTADNYECAQKSIDKFFPNAKFRDVTPEFLHNYEKWMLDAGRSITTVSIYLRALRTLFNIAISESLISKEYYPFGLNKYEVPVGNNIKKSLTLSQISSIYYYQPKVGSSRELAKDMWIFMYLSNGINVKDLCLLKYENMKGSFLEFTRSKTSRTKRNVEAIRAVLTEDTLAIISKYGNKDKSKGNYIFPVLQEGLSAERERQLIHQYTRLINDQMLNIGRELGIEDKLTTYVARHSFSTILKRSGESIEFISEALGHSNIRTTQNYLAGFEDESKIEKTKALTAFKLVKQ